MYPMNRDVLSTWANVDELIKDYNYNQNFDSIWS